VRKHDFVFMLEIKKKTEGRKVGRKEGSEEGSEEVRK
jgi:hypothetical protein